MRTLCRDRVLIVRSVLVRRVRLEVLAGVVVVTRQGDPVDHVVSAGGQLDLQTRGITAVASLSASAALRCHTAANRRNGERSCRATLRR